MTGDKFGVVRLVTAESGDELFEELESARTCILYRPLKWLVAIMAGGVDGL